MNYPLTIPTAEPFLFMGDDIGCLLVHGFTGSPKEMRLMGNYLAEKGCTVLGIRLAGHATNIEDMKRVKWIDWLASVEDGINFLRSAKKRVFVMGLSMGGMLTLMAAAHYQVDGVVAMSTPYQFPSDWRVKFMPVLKWVMPYVQKGPPDWRNPDAIKDHVDYPLYPVPAIIELFNFHKALMSSLAEIRVPVLLIHGSYDQAAPPEHGEAFKSLLVNTSANLMVVKNSGHVVTEEPDREEVFEAAYRFAVNG